MRWIRAAIVGLVVAVIALVAVTVAQSALGLTRSAPPGSSASSQTFSSVGVSGLALVAGLAGFLIGFVYDIRRSRKHG